MNPLLLGAFITGAILMVIVILLTFGSTHMFQPTGHFVIYLSDSAQGLEEGAAVSLDGVRVGQIDQINVLYDRHSRSSLVRILCQVNRNPLTDLHDHPIRFINPKTLSMLVTNGLRAQVQSAGIVGAKFVELGFFDPAEYPPQTGLPKSQYPVLPTVPSTITEVTQDASQILASLRKTDFPGIADQIKKVLAAANGQIDTLKTNQLTTHLAVAAESFGKFMNSSQLHTTVAQIRQVANRLQNLVTNLNSQIQPGGRLDATLAQGKTALASINQTAQSLQDFVTLRNQLGEQTRGLMEQLTQTAQTIERLAAFLERHPNALITGRAQPNGSP